MRLLQSGVKPHNILVCTFTRTAALDLQRELEALNVKGAEEVYAGTLHSYCFGLLYKADVLEITGRTPRTLLQFEERFMSEDLKEPTNESVRDLQSRLKAFSAAWARLQSDDPGWPHNDEDRRFQKQLDAWLRFHAGMLVGELIPEAMKFLNNNPASPVFPNYEHVLADEYQDLNRAEQSLLDTIAANGTLTIVGDEDQSIYSFKHAHPEGITTFHTSHENTLDYSLDDCRRCPTLVVELANSLISHNDSRANRKLLPLSTNPRGEVQVVQWSDSNAEATGLAENIAARIKAGQIATGDVLVLAPRREFGYAVREALKAVGIPAHSFFSEEVFDGNPGKGSECSAHEAFTLLVLLANPDDRVALRCWCGFGSPSFRTGAWKRVRDYCSKSGHSPVDALEQMAGDEVSLPYTSPVIERYEVLRAKLDTLGNLEGQELVDALFLENEPWAEPLRSLVGECGEEATAGTLLNLVRSGVIQPELPTDVDYVRIMSLYKSKGLTDDLVVIAGCIDGLIPTLPRPQANPTPEEIDRAIEEQRRLFFVAITRPKRTLIISSIIRIQRSEAHRMGATVSKGYGRYAKALASRFIQELGGSCPKTATSLPDVVTRADT